MNLQELNDRVQQEAGSNEDLYVKGEGITFVGKGGETLQIVEDPEANGLFDAMGIVRETNLTDWAYGQMLGRMEAPPKQWMRERCPDDLRLTILNRLKEEHLQDRYMVRMHENETRAVLSDQYTRFDNAAFVPMVAEALGTLGLTPKLVRPQTGDQLRCHLAFPEITFDEDPRGGGGIHPSIYISNNEIGGGSVRVAPGTFSQSCLNDVIYGWKNRENTFQLRHRHLDETLMARLVAHSISEALEMSENVAHAFLQTVSVPVEPVSLKPITENWTRKYGISIEASENWLGAVLAESVSAGRADDPRAFDLINGLTMTAQTREPDERHKMEVLAGALIDVYADVRQVEK